MGRRTEQLAVEGRSDETDDYATAGSGPARQSAARDSESAASQSTRHAQGIYHSDKPLILFRRVQSSRLGDERKSNEHILSSNDTLQKDVTGLNRNK